MKRVNDKVRWSERGENTGGRSVVQEPGDGASPLDRHHGAALLCWLSDSTCIGLIELERAPGIGQLRLHAASSSTPSSSGSTIAPVPCPCRCPCLACRRRLDQSRGY